PQFHRLLPAVPSALIGAVVVLEWVAKGLTGIIGRRWRPALTVSVALVPLVSGARDSYDYFVVYNQRQPYSEVTAPARFIANLGPVPASWQRSIGQPTPIARAW